MGDNARLLCLAQKEKPLLLSRGDFIPRAWKVLRRFFAVHHDEPEVISAREREGYFLPRVFAGTTILLSSLPTLPTTQSVVTTGSLFLLEPELPIFSLDASFAWFPEVSSLGGLITRVYSDRSHFTQEGIPPDATRAFTLLALNHPEIFDEEEEWTPHVLYSFLRMLQRDRAALEVLVR
jgi:hypothetical protein